MSKPLSRVPVVLYLLAIMWLVFAVETVLPGNLNTWGILPRQLSGLLGIPFAPFIHHGLWHLIGNSIPLTILGVLIGLNEKNSILEITFFGILLTGLGVWLIGSRAYHVGASGLVMVYWAYLIADGWFERSVKAMLLAGVTLVLYGGMIFIFLDMRAHISWSSHAMGALSGVLIAWLEAWNRKRSRQRT
ncbi:MAG: rhomboid family intramembrane serine protease [Gallionella sp.]